MAHRGVASTLAMPATLLNVSPTPQVRRSSRVRGPPINSQDYIYI